MLGQSLSLLNSRVLFSLLRSFLESFTQSHLTRSFECHSESSPQMETGYAAGDKNDIHLNRSNNCLVLFLLILLPRITKTSICICADLVDLQTTYPRTDSQVQWICNNRATGGTKKKQRRQYCEYIS
jgi:hypothetical protein